jgi:hypothetical protein
VGAATEDNFEVPGKVIPMMLPSGIDDDAFCFSQVDMAKGSVE